MATEQLFNGTTDAATEYTIDAFDFLKHSRCQGINRWRF